ncbi:hypothetical protein K493DRAFT_321195 [Basidiobolus meristosporus CBS 931.73]|uniref:Programmed cell death protein 7 n=1 Tax=Basidiobolus meristosporus CBS 931.73 TaxID=1314790 RepID=A0A1Y1WYB0_9FUNG|nr:hypothetical protein K493DRAFT_321195 [Basidiobolus meristosporus CBS 931.73]|eukprot:ORX78559.1 hypothetical protein K493DRAFT_321195 [Basidiobolus meristosporus CBS 931.73]
MAMNLTGATNLVGAEAAPISADQSWLESWLKTKDISLPTDKAAKKGESSLLEVRRKTFHCMQLQAEFEQKISDLEKGGLNADADDWEKRRLELEELKSQIRESLDSLTSSPKELERLKQKIAKRERHKKWRRRHIKKLQAVRDERQRKRETLHKDIDEWRAEWLEKDKVTKEEAVRKLKADTKVEQVEQKRNKHKDLTELLKEMLKLRDLRREKLKKEGHYFPEQEDPFFDQIRQLDEAIQQEGKQLEDATTEANESKRKEAIEARMKERGTDSIFEYYHQAKFDLDNLVHIRRQWDEYIVPRGTYGASRIPPRYVDPAPPGNHVWASCLVFKE